MIAAALGIKIIPASSPQAKGRIERNHGTQDRLMKKLRRKGIADDRSGESISRDAVLGRAQPAIRAGPASAEDFHAAAPRRVQLASVFGLEEKRAVSNDWVVRYDNRFFQLERQSGRPPARSTVLVYEASAGANEICYRDRAMRCTEVLPQPHTETAVLPSPTRSTPPMSGAVRIKPRRVCDDHPWRRAVEQFGSISNWPRT